MIAIRECRPADDRMSPWHPRFVAMVPAIRRTAEICFRKLRPDLRREMVEEVIVTALAGYARLVARNREDLAFASPLARFAVGQVRQGRQLGARRNVRDVASRYAQQQKGFHVERLDQFNEEEHCWQEIVVEDKKSTPADIAITRIDFAAWLGKMPALRRRIAQCLATGESTFEAARRFAVSPGRISQLRREFQASWQAFHGEAVAGAGAAAA